jgi:putative glutathione S-transferase
MGILIKGVWHDGETPSEGNDKGDFRRAASRFRRFVTADGSSGFKAEAGRYHLYVSYGCPWAHRTLIFRTLKGLDAAISLTAAQPSPSEQGWTFESHPDFPECGSDTVNNFRYLFQAYTMSDPDYTGSVSVPTLWDKETRQIVNNESSEIIRMMNCEFRGIANDLDLYPPHLRTEIDHINDLVYENVNNGVYRCGFATSQLAYDQAFDALFNTLDDLEARLSRQRYLLGSQLTEADIRLFTTLARFDVVYFSLFRCNKRRIADYPSLFNFARDIYQLPGVAATVRPRQYLHYWSIRALNPSGIIPQGLPFDLNSPMTNPA